MSAAMAALFGAGKPDSQERHVNPGVYSENACGPPLGSQRGVKCSISEGPGDVVHQNDWIPGNRDGRDALGKLDSSWS